MSEVNSSDSIEYLYKEYVRLSDKADTYIQSSFNDFRLLAAIGVLLAWKPIAESDLFGEGSSNIVLLIGFLAILFIIAIVGTRDLLKQVIIKYHLEHMASYEAEIKNRLGETGASTFSFAQGWDQWESQRFLPVTVRFRLLFIVAVVGFPTTVLALQEPRWCAAIYLVCAFFALVIYWDAARRLT